MSRNKFYNANKLLPVELIVEIQKYIPDGGYVWIPSKRIANMENRNQRIYYQRRIVRLSEKQTSEMFGISIRRVRQIVKAIGEKGITDKCKAELDAIENREVVDSENENKTEINLHPPKEKDRGKKKSKKKFKSDKSVDNTDGSGFTYD